LNALGELVLGGRAGRIVKIAARRVDLGEIERGLRSVAGVRDAFAMPHPQRADALAAAVVADQDPTALRAQLREKLSAWKIPDRLLVLPEFPLTARGKTDTRRLRALLGETGGERSPR
jgi:acyl-coenzyme A synthetase/AMP-(fatty) acid ligase